MELLNGLKLEILLGGSATTPLDFTAFYRDFPNALNSTGFGYTADTINSSTAKDIVPTPSSGYSRQVTLMTVYNRDSAPQTVTIRLDIAGTKSIQQRVSLSPGERLEYTPSTGYRVLNQQGGVKTQTSQGIITGGGNWTTITLGSDVVNNNAVANTLQDVTGLFFTAAAGNSYQYIFEGVFEAAIATTGSRWTVKAPASSTNVYWNEWTLAATTRTTGTYNADELPAASNTTSVVGVANRFRVVGNLIAGADGDVQLRFASEIAASAITAKANMCTCDWRQVA